jgi:cation diffusion facilitator CzcD-associated flavoprotein CzcO
MTQMCDVAIVGAGPHGLSLAAHLKARGVDYRIFGKPLSTWSQHMPKDMTLKSDGFASNLSAPDNSSTLKAWSARNGVPYADEGLPIPLDTWLTYANWFRKHHVPELEEWNVTALKSVNDAFELTLETNERLTARNVVLAIGITWFSHTPENLSHLPPELLSHSSQHHDVRQFKGREVAVLGGGSSAVDLAYLLHREGAQVRIVARAPRIEYNKVPDAADETLIGRTLRPASGIGRGWRSLFCAEAPLLFYRLPQSIKRRAIESHMHPAAGWFMREKVEAQIPMSLGRSIEKAWDHQGRVHLTLANRNGENEPLVADHLIAATGYRTDMRKVPFLSPELCDRIAPQGPYPILTDTFETPVPGLFAVGTAAMDSFGPLMRFMVGAEFAAPRVASRLARKVGAQTSQRAA